MTRYALTMIVRGDVALLDDDDFVDLLCIPDDHHCVAPRVLEVIVSGGEFDQVAFLVEASSEMAAFERAEVYIREVSGARLTASRLEAELTTVSALASDFGISRQAVDVWTRRESFPRPAFALPTGNGGIRAWEKQAVLDWAAKELSRRLEGIDFRYISKATVEDINSRLRGSAVVSRVQSAPVPLAEWRVSRRAVVTDLVPEVDTWLLKGHVEAIRAEVLSFFGNTWMGTSYHPIVGWHIDENETPLRDEVGFTTPLNREAPL